MKPLSDDTRPSYHPLLGVKELVAFDLETTGLRYKKEEITQIAGVKLGGIRMEIEDTFTSYVDPGKPIPKNIQKLTHISDSDVSGAPKPLEALTAFSAFTRDATLFGHDIYNFDFNFIRRYTRRDDVETRAVRFIDTMDVFEILWKDFSRLHNTLDDICERLSAGLSSTRRHNAQSDAILLAHIFQRIQNHPDLERLCEHVPVHEGLLPVAPVTKGTHGEQAFAPVAKKNVKRTTYSF